MPSQGFLAGNLLPLSARVASELSHAAGDGAGDVAHDHRAAVLEYEVELGEAGDAEPCPPGDEGVAPAVDLGAWEPGDVAAQPVADPVAGRHPGEVPPGQGSPHRAARGERALAVRLGARRAGRVADEVRILLAHEPEGGTLELLPEDPQLAVGGQRGEPEHSTGRPDEALALGVVEHPPSEAEALEDAADELPVQPALRAGELGAELVELPRIDPDARLTRVADSVAVAAAELEAPADPLCRREAEESRLVRNAAGEAPAHAALFRRGEVPPLPRRGADEGLEHRRVAATLIDADECARIAVDPVGADMHASPGGHAGCRDRLHQVEEIVELEIGEQSSADRRHQKTPFCGAFLELRG